MQLKEITDTSKEAQKLSVMRWPNNYKFEDVRKQPSCQNYRQQKHLIGIVKSTIGRYCYIALMDVLKKQTEYDEVQNLGCLFPKWRYPIHIASRNPFLGLATGFP
jgi:hypothetical protein